jgi:hypothetical protein
MRNTSLSLKGKERKKAKGAVNASAEFNEEIQREEGRLTAKYCRITQYHKQATSAESPAVH